MFEELRLRSQMFEVLTGGDFASDNAEGNDEEDGAEGKERTMSLVPLPEELVEDLRVKLHVWADDKQNSISDNLDAPNEDTSKSSSSQSED